MYILILKYNIYIYMYIYMYLCSTLYYELLRLVSSIKTLSRKTGVHMVALLKNLQPMQRVMELNRCLVPKTWDIHRVNFVVGVWMEISRKKSTLWFHTLVGEGRLRKTTTIVLEVETNHP